MADEPAFPKFIRLAGVPLFKKGGPRDDPLSVIKHLDWQMADILSTALGFSYEMVPAMDGQYGTKITKDNASGIVGMVHRKEADLAVSAISPSDDRLEFINFSYPYYIETFNFATKKPQFAPKFLNMVHPFTAPVWMAVAATLLVMSGVFFVALKLLKRGRPYQVVLLKTLGSFLEQETVFVPRRTSGKVLILSWTLGSMFITFSYAAVFLSFLTLPVREQGIRRIRELAEAVEDGRYHVATYKGNFIPSILMAAEEEYLRVLGRDVQKHLVLVSETESTIMNPKANFALLAPHAYIAPLKNKCYISEAQFFSVVLSVGYARDFCCPRAIDRVVSRVAAAGLYRKLLDDQNFRASLKYPEEPEPEAGPLTVVDMSGPFILLILGLVSSSVVFMVEVCVSSCHTRRRTVK